MTDLAALLVAYRDATGAEAAIWERSASGDESLVASSDHTFVEHTRGIATSEHAEAVALARGCFAWRLSIDGNWWFVARRLDNQVDERAAALLTRAVPLIRRLAIERDGATRELAERYEEINLLYAIAELLGGDLPVEISAGTLLRELAVTIGASSAVFLLTDQRRRNLVPVATLGLPGRTYPAVPVDSDTHLAARVFRAGNAMSEAGPDVLIHEPVLGLENGAVLGAAITRANTVGDLFDEDDAGEVLYRTRETPTDMTPLGVVLFGRRDAGTPFSAGDRKLVVAAAAQLGTALHNASLMRAAVEREQLAREMRLAHDLQLKLLPDPNVVGPEARAAARVIPAESVGGDFFLLTRLDADRTGVLIGDVSGHGYQAALVMALALSAAAIHIRAAADPEQTLEAVSASLHDELETTEMSLTLCYVIIDERSGVVRYANAGHPHVFHQRNDGALQRLPAQSLPLGFGTAPAGSGTVTWQRGDRIICFTDGIVDLRNLRDVRLGEEAVLDVLRAAKSDDSPGKILQDIFDCVARHRGSTTLRDDLTVVVVDRGSA